VSNQELNETVRDLEKEKTDVNGKASTLGFVAWI